MHVCIAVEPIAVHNVEALEGLSMSRKRKRDRRPVQQPAKKVFVPPAVIKAKNGGERPVGAGTNGVKNGTSAPTGSVEPVAATQEREAMLPFWARMPFAVMDFWLSRSARGHGKS
jgi:hypothetical protein